MSAGPGMSPNPATQLRIDILERCVAQVIAAKFAHDYFMQKITLDVTNLFYVFKDLGGFNELNIEYFVQWILPIMKRVVSQHNDKIEKDTFQSFLLIDQQSIFGESVLNGDLPANTLPSFDDDDQS
jgi:hypothetical protein